MKRTISAMSGKGSVNHNRRTFTAENVDPTRSHLNIEYCYTPIEDAYHQLFDEAHFYGSKKYGYGTCKDKGELTERIVNMYEKMILPGISEGVCGCIYTQVSDVEEEINGLVAYDRKVVKMPIKEMKKLNDEINAEGAKIS